MTMYVALNAIACLTLFWVCGSFLLVGGQAVTLRQLAIQAGLLLAMVGAMASGVAPHKYGLPIGWWSLTLHFGGAIVALGVYDSKFGIHEQVRHAVFTATETPHKIRRWWRRALHTATAKARAHVTSSPRHPKR